MSSGKSSHSVERSADNDAVYRYIRGEIQFEISLINARVNWLVASQAFLFVPLTIGAKGASLSASLFFPLIPLLGVGICVLVLISIIAAVWRSQQWRAKCRQGAYSGEGENGTFSIVVPYTPAIPLMGYIGGIGVPVLLVTTWILLLLAPPAGS